MITLIKERRFNAMFYLFSTGDFIKEIENIFSVLSLTCRNTCGSLRKLEIAVETLALRICAFITISCSPKFPLVFLLLYGNTENVFYFFTFNK